MENYTSLKCYIWIVIILAEMDVQDVSNLLLKEGCSLMTLCLDESYIDDARAGTETLANYHYNAQHYA
jgi:hypothetical protein